VALQSYARMPGLLETWFSRGLKQLAIETADVLLLGWYSSPPSERLLERAVRIDADLDFELLGIGAGRMELRRWNRQDVAVLVREPAEDVDDGALVMELGAAPAAVEHDAAFLDGLFAVLLGAAQVLADLLAVGLGVAGEQEDLFLGQREATGLGIGRLRAA